MHYTVGLGNSCHIGCVAVTYKCKCIAFVKSLVLQKALQTMNTHSFVLVLGALFYFYFIHIYFIFSAFYNFVFLHSFPERTLHMNNKSMRGSIFMHLQSEKFIIMRQNTTSIHHLKGLITKCHPQG